MVTVPTADDDREDDIVQLAFAILDEESRLWLKTRYQRGAVEAKGVSAHKGGEDTP